MANESVIVSFKNGLKTNLNSATKVAGQVLFALNNDTGTGSIYYDKDTTHRFRMSYDLKDITNTIPESATSITTVANRTYPVALDKDGYLAVNVPWYFINLDFGIGLDQQGTTVNNTGVISVATGTANGTLSVKTGSANAVNVAVKGLQNIAYVAYPSTNATTKYLRGDGTWQVPPDTQYYNGSGLTLTGTTFSIENGDITNAMLAHSSMSIAGNTVNLGGTLTASTLRTSLGLSNALHFIGKATVGISDGGTEDPVISGYNASTDRKAGDVVLSSDGNMEYVWSTANKWEALGPEWLTVSTTTGTAIEFITDFSYNGAVINLEKSTVRTASTSQSGVITINNTTTNSLLNTLTTGSSTPQDADYFISQYAGGGTTTTTYHRRPVSALWAYIKGKADSIYATPTNITSAINALDASDTEVSGEYVSSVTEANGIISVDRTAFAPSISITAGTSSNAPKVNVTINGKSGTAQSITAASTSVYGVTKLSSTASSTVENLAATPKLVATSVSSAINALDAADTAVSGEFVSSVTEANGIISVDRTAFSPSISITAGTSSATPKINVTVNGKSGTAQSITTASTSVYGATKLSSTSSSTEEGLAATPKLVATSISKAIGGLDSSDSAVSGQYVTQVVQADGIISVDRANFSPSISITAGTSSATPKVNVTVNGKSGTAQSLTTASTSVYGATKLSSTASSSEEGLAATPKLVTTSITNAINGLDASDSAVAGQYVSSVVQANGVISVDRTNFAPSISITAGTASAAPKVNVTVNTKSGTAQAITTATTGVYGVTKLSSTASSTEESLAATPKGVQAAIDTVKYKVTQNGDNENKEFPILLKYTNNTTNETNTVKYNNVANHQTTINPSTGMVSAKSFKVDNKVQLQYDATTESLNFVFI